MNKLLILLLIATGVYALFAHNQSSKNAGIAQTYQAERDSLLIANKCPQPLRVRVYTGACLNSKAARHDLDLHVSNLRTAAGDTVGFMPLCDSCFENLSPEARWTFYEKLLWIYEQRNRQDIAMQVKNGL